ncbi:MAG: uncharacterized protein KVP18_001810 [Porospora cf. gigantea A]|uniref:uncharacterized protein n=1 Tax=Porospora cf. gigantea A TaxID=2853593 RepID=UPI00355A5357|nr:MAG: hypothetical protein KVP18_001810 [Porospora cf. gigantea A]
MSRQTTDKWTRGSYVHGTHWDHDLQALMERSNLGKRLGFGPPTTCISVGSKEIPLLRKRAISLFDGDPELWGFNLPFPPQLQDVMKRDFGLDLNQWIHIDVARLRQELSRYGDSALLNVGLSFLTRSVYRSLIGMTQSFKVVPLSASHPISRLDAGASGFGVIIDFQFTSPLVIDGDRCLEALTTVGFPYGGVLRPTHLTDCRDFREISVTGSCERFRLAYAWDVSLRDSEDETCTCVCSQACCVRHSSSHSHAVLPRVRDKPLVTSPLGTPDLSKFCGLSNVLVGRLQSPNISYKPPATELDCGWNIDAVGAMNELAMVNDPTGYGASLGEPSDPNPNLIVMHVKVFNVPCIFYLARRPIAQYEEALVNYGPRYFDGVRGRVLEVDEFRTRREGWLREWQQIQAAQQTMLGHRGSLSPQRPFSESLSQVKMETYDYDSDVDIIVELSDDEAMDKTPPTLGSTCDVMVKSEFLDEEKRIPFIMATQSPSTQTPMSNDSRVPQSTVFLDGCKGLPLGIQWDENEQAWHSHTDVDCQKFAVAQYGENGALQLAMEGQRTSGKEPDSDGELESTGVSSMSEGPNCIIGVTWRQYRQAWTARGVVDGRHSSRDFSVAKWGPKALPLAIAWRRSHLPHRDV